MYINFFDLEIFPPTKQLLGITRHINLVEKIMNFPPIFKMKLSPLLAINIENVLY